MLGNLVQTQSFLAKEKPVFHANTLIIFIGHYRMLTGRVPTANYFLGALQIRLLQGHYLLQTIGYEL